MEAPEHARAWLEAAKGLDNPCQLDKKSEALAYLACLQPRG